MTRRYGIFTQSICDRSGKKGTVVFFLLREGEVWKRPLFWGENKLTVNRLPLITSLCEELPPRGEATERLTILCTQREACIKGNE